MAATRKRRFKDYQTIYNGDRWFVPGETVIYFATCRVFNGVGHWELYRVDEPGKAPEFCIKGIGNGFAVLMRDFYNTHNIFKIPTPRKNRVPPHLLMWGLNH